MAYTDECVECVEVVKGKVSVERGLHNMIELDGEMYYNAASAARYLRITRFMFYYNIKGKVGAYRKEGCGRLLYKQSELIKFRSIQPVAS